MQTTTTSYCYYTEMNSLGNFSDSFDTGYGLDLLSGDPDTTEVYFVRVATGNTRALFSAYGP